MLNIAMHLLASIKAIYPQAAMSDMYMIDDQLHMEFNITEKESTKHSFMQIRNIFNSQYATNLIFNGYESNGNASFFYK